ncbi:MAG: ketoacyl-ACP synthase III [Kiritimatiellae bacterium]|jgi:3-oxoacyl-[acyl-carrier-protein] synthase-3|nr:ketoacyl-ACP synthase III [Kiritimatiellia bacterium]MDD3584599.1 ketoacyl-ACP synthase III [Kiritimatiellia bacterium]HON46952.1 beta-ketoacyl-ACP synthase III [Kiritimatiellia bacterium]
MSERTLTAKITGVGKALPEKRLTNADLEKMVETSDAWIRQRVGIRERRIAAPGEYASDLAARAAAAALAQSGIAADQIDLILVATSTPDTIYPSVACLVQKAIGALHAGVLDISAACTGFVYGANLAWGMIRSGLAKHVLVIGAEVNSAIVNWKDRDTCILFGDGAGAAVFSVHASDTEGVLSAKLGGDGNLTDLLEIANSGVRPNPDVPGRYITMQGNEVFKQAVRNMSECAVCALDRAGLSSNDISLMIAHQANTRIIDAVARRLDLPSEKVFVNIADYGNTSAATIPIALCEALEQGRVKKGDVLVLVAFGAGLTWGALTLRWV